MLSGLLSALTITVKAMHLHRHSRGVACFARNYYPISCYCSSAAPETVEEVMGVSRRYSRISDSMLPLMRVTAPAAPNDSSWPYQITYDNTLENSTRPELLYVSSDEIQKTYAATSSEKKHRNRRNEWSSEQGPYRWSGGGQALEEQEKMLESNPLYLARRALRVVYSDADLIVVDKPAGLLCVPGIYSRFSLASAAQIVFGIDRVDQMIVHRLDEATSGVLVLARTPDAQKRLHDQFRRHTIRKRYTALVTGLVGGNDANNCRGETNELKGEIAFHCVEGEIDLPLRRHPDRQPWQVVDPVRGKPSLTQWKLVNQYRLQHPQNLGIAGNCPLSRVELNPITGRSHQLRVHMAAFGHPIVGDDLYGSRAGEGNIPSRLCLHATSIAFLHPTTRSPVEFEVGCPF